MALPATVAKGYADMDLNRCQSRPAGGGTSTAGADTSSGPLPGLRSIRSWLPHPTAVADARRHTRAVLTGWGLRSKADDAEMIVSELVTNALTASTADWTITLRLFSGTDSLLILVWDQSGELPEQRDPDDDEIGGRGLIVVEALSDAWGAVQGARGGKVVWARIGTAIKGISAAPIQADLRRWLDEVLAEEKDRARTTRA